MLYKLLVAMFESLFDNDVPVGKETSARHSTQSAPVTKRQAHRFCGLRNQGATCYLNSLIQTLFLTPEFRDAIFQLKEQELGRCLNGSDKTQERAIPVQLQRLFARLQLLDVSDWSTSNLLDSFGWNNDEERQQQDVQELNRALFSAIEQSLVGTPGEHIVSGLYKGNIVNKIECSECHRVSSRQEDFLDLCLAVSGQSSLHEALANMFLMSEQLNQNNKYFCDGCKKLVDATKSARVKHLPPILTVSLLRFDFDMAKMERYKNTSSFSFPMELDMASYCDTDTACGDVDNHRYALFSVVIHRGSAYGGHYHAYIRDVSGLGTWSPPDTEKIQVSDSKSADGSDVLDLSAPVELITTILRRSSSAKVPLDRLCGELMKLTGVSWNSRFKGRYGPFLKFIQKNDHVFLYDSNANSVGLRDNSKKSLLELSSQRSPEPAASASNTTTVSGDAGCGYAAAAQLNVGTHWFDFDDSHIHPIHAKDIEKQYEGKESAYLLFYRNIKLDNTVAGLTSAPPHWLLEEIVAENCALEAERQEYDCQLNAVTVTLLFDHCYVCDGGYVKPRDSQLQTNIELTIDRRKPLYDLLTQIKEANPAGNKASFVLHLARDTSVGLYFYESISTTDVTKSISEAGITSGCKLFVWDGLQVDGKGLYIGPDYEPILIDVTYSSDMTLIKALPKFTPLSEVKAIIISHAGLDASSVRILWTKSGSAVDKKATLKDICEPFGRVRLWQLRRNMPLLIPFVSECGKDATTQTVIVENRYEHSGDRDKPKIALEVDTDLVFKELMSIAKTHMKCSSNDVSLKLLEPMDNLLLPLDMLASVGVSSLTDESVLVIAPEKKLKHNEISVTFSVHEDDKTTKTVEAVVSKSSTVNACLQLALKELSLKEDQWHLCKTNWQGEASATLDDGKSTLEACGVKDGDCLVVEFGSLEVLNLSVWLVPTVPPIAMAASSDNFWWPSSDSNGTDSSQDTIELAPSQLTFMGAVVINRKVTLNELREQVLTLPGAESALCMPTIQFMRLWLMDSGRPFTALRGNSQTLQQLKLTSRSIIGVQQLMQEEDLSITDVVLRVRLRRSATLSYSIASELVWRTKDDRSLASLCTHIANQLALPPEHLVLAKYWPTRHEWSIIQENTSSPQTGKGKKAQKAAAATKKNLLQSPYLLKDWDTIGVKNLASDPDEDDFMTLEDRLYKEEVLKQKEEKAKRNEDWLGDAAKSADVNSPSKPRRPEANLTIYVPDYANGGTSR